MIHRTLAQCLILLVQTRQFLQIRLPDVISQLNLDFLQHFLGIVRDPTRGHRLSHLVMENFVPSRTRLKTLAVHIQLLQGLRLATAHAVASHHNPKLAIVLIHVRIRILDSWLNRTELCHRHSINPVLRIVVISAAILHGNLRDFLQRRCHGPLKTFGNLSHYIHHVETHVGIPRGSLATLIHRLRRLISRGRHPRSLCNLRRCGLRRPIPQRLSVLPALNG